MKKLMSLTDAQHDRMASFAQEWIEHGWRTTPLTEEEWALWEQGARKCYEFAGIPWPGVVVRVSSPIVGAFAAPIANVAIARAKRGGAVVLQAISNGWWYRFGGLLWPTWQAYIAYFRDVVELQVAEGIWDRSRAYDATRERDGTRHTVGLTIPTDCRTAISAAAWTFGIQEAEYKELARAT